MFSFLSIVLVFYLKTASEKTSLFKLKSLIFYNFEICVELEKY